MSDHLVLDTFPAFLSWWPTVADEPVAVRAERWHDEYLAAQPELRGMLVADALAMGTDWRTLTCQRTFGQVPELLPAMRQAYAHLPAAVAAAVSAAETRLGLDFALCSVFYVGLGYAGWATRYAGRPAVLYGLEGLAENHWTDHAALFGLAAHEVGHLLHAERRRLAGCVAVPPPWGYLYQEGFAMVCERLCTGANTWHMALSQPGWEQWCQEHRGWLAAEFLRTAGEGRSVNPFFGSWYNIAGWRQTGYWLGEQMLRRWLQTSDLPSVAVLDPAAVAVQAQLTLSDLSHE